MTYYVYKLTNETNSKSYIGITSRTPAERWAEHCSRSRCGQRDNRLYDAMRKYGEKQFILKTLAQTEYEHEVRALETFYIERFDTFNRGYNCNLGGCGALDMADETKLKISEAQRGKVIPFDVRRKMSLAKKGDSACAENFGQHTGKGELNPRSKWFLVRMPDEHIRIGRGLRAFCRDENILHSKLSSKGKTKGYELIGTFNDYPFWEYAQASGSAIHPTG